MPDYKYKISSDKSSQRFNEYFFRKNMIYSGSLSLYCAVLYVLLRGSKTRIRLLGNEPSIKQAISESNIPETLFSNSNLRRNNQHKNKTSLPYLKAKTNEGYLQTSDNTHIIRYRTNFIP